MWRSEPITAVMTAAVTFDSATSWESLEATALSFPPSPSSPPSLPPCPCFSTTTAAAKADAGSSNIADTAPTPALCPASAATVNLDMSLAGRMSNSPVRRASNTAFSTCSETSSSCRESKLCWSFLTISAFFFSIFSRRFSSSSRLSISAAVDTRSL